MSFQSQILQMLMFRRFSTATKRKILEGYRIIDASRILVASFASLMLADMGAEVIKIEQPGAGDETRKWGPPFLGPDSTYFMSINRNKKSMTVNLKEPEGNKIIQGLVKNSDIFLQNFTPSAAEKLKIDYHSLQQHNPKLIYACVQGFPLDSSWKDKAAFDLTIQAMTGFMHITGDPNGPPYKVGYAVTDILAGMHLLQGVMGAIIHREKTGEGQMVNTSLLESNVYSLCYVVGSWLNGQKEYQRMGNQHPNISPYSVFKTADNDYIVVGVATDHQFFKLCEMLQMEMLDIYKTNKERCANRESLNKLLQDKFSQNWTKQQLIKEFSERGIPFSEIHSVKQLFDKPEIQNMNLNETIYSQKYQSDIHFTKNPLHFSQNSNAQVQEPPLLGEHTNQILKEFLNYSDQKIEDLRRNKVI